METGNSLCIDLPEGKMVGALHTAAPNENYEELEGDMKPHFTLLKHMAPSPFSYSHSSLCLIFTLKMVTAMHTERVGQFQHTPWPNPVSQSYKSDKDCGNQRAKICYTCA
jgi:hypothetical protein